LQEPEVYEALVAHTYGNELRMVMTYTWNQPYCQALAWDRIEHNGSTTLSVMVPNSANVTSYGVRARDGDNGKAWSTCAKTPCRDPGPGELDYEIKGVNDSTGKMKGFKAHIKNGNSQHVRNVELFIDYK
jgi:hypothetical protein